MSPFKLSIDTLCVLGTAVVSCDCVVKLPISIGISVQNVLCDYITVVSNVQRARDNGRSKSMMPPHTEIRLLFLVTTRSISFLTIRMPVVSLPICTAPIHNLEARCLQVSDCCNGLFPETNTSIAASYESKYLEFVCWFDSELFASLHFQPQRYSTDRQSGTVRV